MVDCLLSFTQSPKLSMYLFLYRLLNLVRIVSIFRSMFSCEFISSMRLKSAPMVLIDFIAKLSLLLIGSDGKYLSDF